MEKPVEYCIASKWFSLGKETDLNYQRVHYDIHYRVYDSYTLNLCIIQYYATSEEHHLMQSIHETLTRKPINNYYGSINLNTKTYTQTFTLTTKWALLPEYPLTCLLYELSNIQKINPLCGRLFINRNSMYSPIGASIIEDIENFSVKEHKKTKEKTMQI